jgi:hypothetical protein
MSKEKSQYDERSLKLWEDIGKQEYLMRRQEFNHVDTKLTCALLLNITIISLFINFIEFPTKSSSLYLYFISISFFVISLSLLMFALFPKKVNVILFKHNKENSYNDELRVLTKQYEIAIDKQSKIIENKLILFKISCIIFIIALFLTLLIKIGV